MNKRVISIGLNRAKLIAIDTKGKVSKKLKAIFLAELANLGYRLENPELYNDSVLENFDEIIDTLTSMKGGDVDYVPLFAGFPNKVDYDSVLKLTLGNLIDKFGFENYFDFAKDIAGFEGLTSSRPQTDEELEDGIENQASRKSDKHTEWTSLKLSIDIESDVRKYLTNNLYAKSSIKEALKEDIEFLIGHYGLEFLDSTKVVFKEIKSYVMKYLWNKGDMITLSRFVGTPTDILRMFAALTDSDISLSEKIKFPKMKRPQRRFILESLEGCSNIAENLNSYKGLWLNLGRYIHPGEYKAKYPKTFEAFDMLRNGKVVTYNGALEKAIEKRDLTSVLKLVTARPGVFGRKLHEILDVFSDKKGIIKEFKMIADQMELKNLLVLETFFKTINDSAYRTVINKRGKVIVFKNDKKGKLSAEKILKLGKAIKKAIKAKLEAAPLKFEDDTKVWLDPDLRNFVIPLSMRKQSDGLMNIARGTRLKFDKSKIFRLFTYWKEAERTTDFDTSLIEFDENMNMVGQVSYTNISSSGIGHSGDITSSRNGAAEFVDIDFDKIKTKAKYLALQVYIYSGESFTQVEKSYSGFMLRDKAKAGRKTFDIKTVVNKFNMVGKGKYAIPMIIDVEKGEAIFVDLFMNGANSFNRVEGAVNDVAVVTRELIKMVDTKPNMLDLLKYQIDASNAELVDTKEEATVTYGITECTHNVDRVDEILADLI